MNAIQKYFKYRQSLIDQYAKGDMTKREYLQKNYEAVVYGDIGPFRNMDTVEKALFNYQYYNALAKENKTISTTRDMDYELKRDYLEKSNYYYSRKDRATLTALRMLDFRGVVAYFVKVRIPSRSCTERPFFFFCCFIVIISIQSIAVWILNTARRNA